MAFEENIFTLSRPGSLPPFLARLKHFQRAALRCLRIYSTSRITTAWIGPLPDQDLGSQLLGLRRLEVLVELLQNLDLQVLEEMESDKRFSGLGDLFQGTALSEVELWVVGKNRRCDEWLWTEEMVMKVEALREQLRGMLLGSHRLLIDGRGFAGRAIQADYGDD